MYKYAWQQAADDFFCMRRGRKMEWEISDKIRLFIDGYEIDLEAEI